MPLKNRTILPNQNGCREHGYLLAGATIMILIVVSLLSSFAFVSGRDNRFRGNYAMGERMADLAIAAHSYAQLQEYGAASPVQGIDLLAPGEMTMTDGFAFRPVAGVNFSAEVRGCSECPVLSDAVVPDEIKAASGYLHFRIRTGLQQRPPSDTIALLAGASNRGMGRVGFVDTNIPAGDQCDGAPTRVRWGPEVSACLNGSHMTALLFTDVQAGDIIVPVWETALAKMNGEAVYRYRQPERPELNMMTTDMLMDNNSITGIQNLRGERMLAGTGTTRIGGDMIMRARNPVTLAKNTATFNRGVDIGAPLRIYRSIDNPGSPDDGTPITGENNPPALTVTSDMTIGSTGNVNVNVTNTINAPRLAGGTRPTATSANTGAVTTIVAESTDPSIVNTVYTNTLTQLPVDTTEPPDAAMQVTLTAGAEIPNIAIRNPPSSDPSVPPVTFTMDALEVRDPTRNLVVMNNIDSSSGNIITNNMYSAQMAVRNNGSFDSVQPASRLDWSVGSIDQSGNQESPAAPNDVSRNQFLKLASPDGFTPAPTLTVNTDCIGKACPDNVTEEPGEGPF